nr:hypothetical protein [Mesorhizobium sp.]
MGDTGRDIEALRRIIARLASFARLAQRASGLPFPLRFVLLAILRLAEAVARDFVIDETGADWLGESPKFRNRPADATLLALRFCALAEALVVLLRLEVACLFARRDEALPAVARCSGCVAAVAARRLPLPPLRGPPTIRDAGAPAILHARPAARQNRFAAHRRGLTPARRPPTPCPPPSPRRLRACRTAPAPSAKRG